MPSADFTWALPSDLDRRVSARLADLRAAGVLGRIWEQDSRVWTGADEDRWLGWLALPSQSRAAAQDAVRFAGEIRAEGVTDVVLLGMGGSSLAPEVVRDIIGRTDGYASLHVVDSTDPAQIASVERAIDVRRTLFLVASKSGSTLEVNILKQYFFERVSSAVGAGEAGQRFALTTDPGSKMQSIAESEGFRAIFAGIPQVGGRYSALSNFGLVPAALIGADPVALLESAQVMAMRCADEGSDNAAFELGAILGELALAGRDKPTLIAPANLAPFGAWLEQLVAESLGKQGKAIIPIEGEMPGAAEVYGDDRVFVHIRSASAPDATADALADRLERGGAPIVRIDWIDRYALGAEFFRWEFATAVAGAVLGVHPFDQPDVEAAKIVTRRIAAEYEQTGRLPAAVPIADEATLAVYADAQNASWLRSTASADDCIAGLLDQLRPGDYFGLLVFVEMNAPNRNALDAIRTLVRDRRRVATTVGFGPRYLHSTGQAHKGGPNTGVFLILTCDDPVDLPVPGQRYSFGTIKLAQARGDFEVLASRGRRVLRVHLKEVDRGLRSLHAIVQRLRVQ